MMFGKSVRLERIVDRNTGNCVIVPMDHGISIGPVAGLVDMKKTVDDVANGGATAVLMHKGLIRYSYRSSGHDIGLIMHLSASTDLGVTSNSKVLVATVDVLFRRLTPISAVYYLLGIASSCICCYFFFILTTRIRIGYIFLAAFVLVFLHCLYRSLRTVRYRCGNCGNQLTQKGICPHCGTLNE